MAQGCGVALVEEINPESQGHRETDACQVDAPLSPQWRGSSIRKPRTPAPVTLLGPHPHQRANSLFHIKSRPVESAGLVIQAPP